MAHGPNPEALNDAALEFLTERHLATLATTRPTGTPHVVAVGFTYDRDTRIARVITRRRQPEGAQRRTRRLRRRHPCRRPALAHPGGSAVVSRERLRVADAEDRYARRYRQPKENPRRVVIEITVTRAMGSANLFG